MRDDTDNKQSRCKYRDCSGENIPTPQRMTFFPVKLISIFTELLTPKYKYINQIQICFIKAAYLKLNI